MRSIARVSVFCLGVAGTAQAADCAPLASPVTEYCDVPTLGLDTKNVDLLLAPDATAQPDPYLPPENAEAVTFLNSQGEVIDLLLSTDEGSGKITVAEVNNINFCNIAKLDKGEEPKGNVCILRRPATPPAWITALEANLTTQHAGLQLEIAQRTIDKSHSLIQAQKSESAEQDEDEDEDESAKGEDSRRACTLDDFGTISAEQKAAIASQCKEANELCLLPNGEVLSPVDLHEGQSINVVLYRPEGREIDYQLNVRFKRSVLLELRHFEDDKNDSSGWIRGPQHTVRLSSAGQLTIGIQIVASSAADYRHCTLTRKLEATRTFDVTGHYHFMLGVMPTYAGLFDRRYTLNRSDDGVQRVFAQDVQEIDLAVTLTAYPWGVSPDQFIAYGLLLGTGLRSLGKTWYGGIELSSPIGFGLAGGVALVQVPALDADFLPGQPLADTQVPIHNTLEPTWFFGINVQAELFRRAFQGLADEDD